MTGLELDVVEKPCIDAEVYFIPDGDYHLTPSRAVGVAKRKLRDEYDADKVAAKKMRETRNGMYVLAMAKPEPNYLDQVALKVLRDNPDLLGEVTMDDFALLDDAAEKLVEKVFEKIHSPESFGLHEVQEALALNRELYDVGP